jgi:hypothetical protein
VTLTVLTGSGSPPASSLQDFGTAPALLPLESCCGAVTALLQDVWCVDAAALLKAGIRGENQWYMDDGVECTGISPAGNGTALGSPGYALAADGWGWQHPGVSGVISHPLAAPRGEWCHLTPQHTPVPVAALSQPSTAIHQPTPVILQTMA